MVELDSRVEELGPDTSLGTQGGYWFSAVSYKTQVEKNAQKTQNKKLKNPICEGRSVNLLISSFEFIK